MTIKFGVRFQSVRVGVRSLWRDLRAGELRLLMVAVTLAVGALTAVGFFADRIQSGLSRDARQLLGGDAVLASDQPTPPAVLAQAQAMGLKAVTSIGFPTMARADDAQGAASRLVALKAVEGDYPSLTTVTRGRVGLAGPLCNLGIGRTGRVYVVAAGVAWHAGQVKATT